MGSHEIGSLQDLSPQSNSYAATFSSTPLVQTAMYGQPYSNMYRGYGQSAMQYGTRAISSPEWTSYENSPVEDYSMGTMPPMGTSDPYQTGYILSDSARQWPVSMSGRASLTGQSAYGDSGYTCQETLSSSLSRPHIQSNPPNSQYHNSQVPVLQVPTPSEHRILPLPDQMNQNSVIRQGSSASNLHDIANNTSRLSLHPEVPLAPIAGAYGRSQQWITSAEALSQARPSRAGSLSMPSSTAEYVTMEKDQRGLENAETGACETSNTTLGIQLEGQDHHHTEDHSANPSRHHGDGSEETQSIKLPTAAESDTVGSAAQISIKPPPNPFRAGDATSTIAPLPTLSPRLSTMRYAHTDTSTTPRGQATRISGQRSVAISTTTRHAQSSGAPSATTEIDPSIRAHKTDEAWTSCCAR